MEDVITRRENQRIESGREELVERMSRLVPKDGTLEAFPGLLLNRSTKPVDWGGSLCKPAFCFVAQGSKQALLGEEVFHYDPGHYLLFTVDLPVAFEVKEATDDNPFLGLRLDLDPSIVATVAVDFEIRLKKSDAGIKAMNVSAVNADLLETVIRLIRLLDNSNEIMVLGPHVLREIVYRLLIGGQGARLAHMLAAEGDTRRISKAIGHMREHFDEPLRIENVARELGMSVSGFHHHFKSVTSMSPLQFQKQIRMQEARRLMLGEDMDAASAAFRVGYEDPSYFGRDYKKHFGAPPQRDIARFRESLAASN